MVNNNREKRKNDATNNSGAKRVKRTRNGKSDKSEAVANEQQKVNKARKSLQNEMRDSGDKHESGVESASHKRIVAINNNAQVSNSGKKVASQTRRRSATVEPCCSTDQGQSQKKQANAPLSREILGDGIEVTVDTTEFGSEDEGVPMQNIHGDTKLVEMNEGYFDMDRDSDGESDHGNFSKGGKNSRHTTLDETTVSAPENEIFFNFHHSQIPDDGDEPDSPTMKEVVEQMVNEQLAGEKEKLKQEFEMLEKMRAEYRELLSEKSKGDDGTKIDELISTPKTNVKGNKGMRGGNEKRKTSTPVMVNKSPSDMTIYAPALARTPDKNGKKVEGGVGADYINNIANFVEHMWLQHEMKEARVRQGKNGGDTEPIPEASTSGGGDHDSWEERRNELQANADKYVVDAELFKASIEPPTGEKIQSTFNGGHISTDDEFFHLTCHIDSALRDKIKKGQYVDLDKLLPGDRFKREGTHLE